MADYKCCDCGMGVKGIVCSNCSSELEQIKSPMCHNHDMDVVEPKE